ncbi:PEP-CTERM protein-sorting domain-containing protein [Nitrosospira sp. Nl5]|uniref:FxDxF family PEP-CTERM protein n=1 Tax=Nitrosospira sp. Nl5 TaxID=200120 RepID=UPI0008890327|nr:FxDxF family PEP-CTERM protein [Nitrosospira sp. Nl5]SCY76579.1 PEP-CTERM protein-sorting domain-containing protein [Nitrosospira sp. Nl5]
MINSSLKQAVAVAMLAGASIGAHAASIDAGTVRFDVPTSFAGIVMGGGATGLNDTVLFTPEGPAIRSGFSVIDFPITLSGDGGTFALELATVTLSSTGADGAVGGGDDQMLKTATFTDIGNDNSHISFSYDQPLDAAAYYLNITGVTSGTLGGAYSGAIQISPVPEPESFAMLLAGLGLMGAVVRRRSMNKTS